MGLRDISWWYPVLIDGHFFTENPQEKSRAGNVRNDVTYVITSVSFEGSIGTTYQYLFGFTKETFTFSAMNEAIKLNGLDWE